MELKDFLKDRNDKLSSGRLFALGAWIASTIVLVFFNQSTEALGVYLGTWGVVHVGGKVADKLGS